MYQIPKVGLNDTKILREQLPIGSVDLRWGQPFARFTPFYAIGDSDAFGHALSNWTNLFLWQKLGPNVHHKDAEMLEEIHSIDTVNDETLSKIKELGASLSHELQEVKDLIGKIKSREDLDNVKDLINQLHDRSKIEYRMTRMELQLQKMSNKLDRIGEKLGIRMDG